MKNKIVCLLCCLIAVLSCMSPFAVLAAQEIPQLVSVEFKNATINEKFTPDTHEYTLNLEHSDVSPTLKSYAIKGNCDIFVTYKYDESNHQTGLEVTLKFDTGSAIYTFNYANLPKYEVNSNNLLSGVICTYGEIEPKFNDDDTAYKLYIPSDLTQIVITPVTKDINAYCAPIELTLDNNQTPKITLVCTASNGDKREYLLNIKRVDKTTEEVKAEMAQPDYTSFVDGTKLYQKPEVQIIAGSVILGIIVIALLFVFTRRIAVSPYDKDEKPFYSPIE